MILLTIQAYALKKLDWSRIHSLQRKQTVMIQGKQKSKGIQVEQGGHGLSEMKVLA